MKILSVVAEVAPFAHVGGLARGTLFLGQALEELNHDVRVFTPLHASVLSFFTEKNLTISDLHRQKLKLPIQTEIINFPRSSKNLNTYFLNYPDYFSLRSRVYDYGDDHQRFYLFSVACLEWLLVQQKQKGWLPEVLHCHDWHTGYLIDLLKRNERYQSLRGCKVLFTVHNFRYQNILKLRYLAEGEQDTGVTTLAKINDPELRTQNALLRGILYADWVNTVSPTHALEVQKPEYGYNLAEVLRAHNQKLSGILNGLNYSEFDPAALRIPAATFGLKNWRTGKAKNKLQLQHLFGLPQGKEKILLAYVGRMTSQKGLELLTASLTKIFQQNAQVQFVALGDGEDHYCDLMWTWAQKYPDQTAVKLYHDPTLPKQIFAGADMLLVPSNYEPGGIVALEAMRYGAVPVVRKTGGLCDAVIDFEADPLRGNGFVFQSKTVAACTKAITQALEIYAQPHQWNKVTQQALKYRQTWKQSAEAYVALMQKVITS